MTSLWIVPVGEVFNPWVRLWITEEKGDIFCSVD